MGKILRMPTWAQRVRIAEVKALSERIDEMRDYDQQTGRTHAFRAITTSSGPTIIIDPLPYTREWAVQQLRLAGHKNPRAATIEAMTKGRI